MKKFTLAAIAAVAALGMNAQYVASSPYADITVSKEGKQIYDLVVADNGTINGLQAAGRTVNDYRIDDVTRWFYIWDNTFLAGDGSYPGIGFSDLQSEGYTSIQVGTVGWSGAGFNVNKPGATTPAGYNGINVAHWNDNTRFHLAYRTPGVAPTSFALIIADSDAEGDAPAKVALGDNFNDNGAIFPAIAGVITEEWQAVDISFADLKKFCPTFNPGASATWTGNILSVLGGGTTGRAVSLDAFYFYTPDEENAVEGVADDAELVITANTVNSTVAGITVYDLQGRVVKATEGTVLGLEGLDGVLLVKGGNTVKKVVK